MYLIHVVVKKVKLQVWISEEINSNLRRMVKEKYVGQWGLSWEVEQALRMYLEQGGGLHTHTKNANLSSRTMMTLGKVCSALKERGLESGSRISQAGLERIISNVAGGDRRTLKKYTNYMVNLGILHVYDTLGDEPLFEVKKLEP